MTRNSSFPNLKADYEFQPHEMPIMPGSPANPDHPAGRKVAYLLIGIFLGLAGGAQNGFLLANTAALKGDMELTPVQAGWISVAFYSTYACMSMLLFRVRQEFGIQSFVRYAILGLVAANFVQVLELGYYYELGARGVAGIAAAGLSALAIYYLMQGLPASARIGGLVLGIGLIQTAFPLARAMSPSLLIDGDMSRAFQFQFALSLLTLGALMVLPLPQGHRRKTFEWLDLPSFALFIIGVAALITFIVQGRVQWWDTPWLGWSLALAILCLGIMLLIEMNRANPMLDISWLSSRAILSLAISGAGVRILVGEQSFGAGGLLSALGYGNEQLSSYYLILAGSTLAGTIISVVRLDPKDLTRPILFALLVIAIAAFADTRSGILSRPSDLYVTQAMIGFAAVFAMGPVMMEGMIRALAAGPAYVASFIAVFSLSQTVGGLAGVSALSAVHTIQLKTHLIDAGATLSSSNPELARAIGQAAQRLGPTFSDAALRQQAASAAFSRQMGKDAAVLAFNDVFFLVGSLASLAFIVVLVPWVINRIRGYNPLSKELVLLQTMVGKST